MEAGGAKVWYFADGWLPAKTKDSKLEAHEALMILNPGSVKANIKLDIYFEDKNPVKDIPVMVEAERVICLRLDDPNAIKGVRIPPTTQYALRVRSDVNIVVQFGRLDTTQSNLAYYINAGWCGNT